MEKNLVKPSTIRLECSSICQLACPCCVAERQDVESVVGSGLLKFADFRRLMDQNRWVAGIELSNQGEIFLNPELLHIMQYAYLHGVALTAWNGVNLNRVEDDVLEGLVKYQIQGMTCSLDGATAETYRLYRIGGDLEQVIDNIKKINFYKEQYRSEYPELAWQFVVFGHNEHEIAQARQLARELKMDFFVKLSWDPCFSPVRNRELVARELGIPAVTRDEYRETQGRGYLQDRICSQLWVEPQINWDGRVLGCCANYRAEFGANAFTDGLLAAINSERMSYARAMLLGDKPPREDIPCARCGHYQTMKSSDSWLRLPTITQQRRTRPPARAFDRVSSAVSVLRHRLSRP